MFQENTEYKEIIWPVAPVYSFIQEYMGDENLHFPREDEDFPFKDHINGFHFQDKSVNEKMIELLN